MARAVLASLLLHVLVALAWQPPPVRPPEERVLRAVLLPALQARPEAEPAPPPVPARRPDATARTARAERAAAPGFSEDEAASGSPALPAPRPALLTPAVVPAAAASAAGAAQLTEVSDPAAPEPPAAHAVGLAASRQETVRPDGMAALAAVAAIEGEGPARDGPPAAPPPSAGTRLASASAAPGRAEAVFTAGTASLAEAPAGPPVRGTSPTAGPPVLQPAGAGRPLPVTGAAGGNEFVEYADDNPAFVYPRQAARLGLQGTVLLEVEVLPDGRPGEIHLRRGSGHALLDQDALRQMAIWRFKPAARLGRPHAARAVVPIHYRLHDAP